MTRLAGNMRWAPVLCVSFCAFASLPSRAAERELEDDAPPSTVEDVESPLERVFPRPFERDSLFPWMREQIEDLPPFLADTVLDVHYRTYYLRQERTIDLKSEAWAIDHVDLLGLLAARAAERPSAGARRSHEPRRRSQKLSSQPLRMR